MSGIAGIFNQDGGPVSRGELETLAMPARHRAVDGRDGWIGPFVGIVHQHFHVTPESRIEPQPFVARSGVVVALDGRLDNRDELIDRSLPETAAPGCGDGALIAAAYARFGERFVSHLNGDFAIALFDPAATRLVLARDRMGARTLYYRALARTLLFASEIKSLLAHPAVAACPDEDSVADLVIDGYSDGQHTCFEDVRSIPAGYQLLVTPHRIVIERHWDFDPGREIRFRDIDDYAQAFRGLFEQAVRRRLRSAHPVAVAVSGGLDSSSIFCEAARLTRGGRAIALRGFAQTFPADPDADERTFLAEAQRASGLPIARLPVAGVRLLDEPTRAAWHIEAPGLMWDAHSATLAAAREAGCRSILDGYFGDQMLFDRAYLFDLVRRGRWVKVRRDLREFGAWMIDVDPGEFERQFGHSLVRWLPPRWLFSAVKRRRARRRIARMRPRWFTRRFLTRAVERALSRPDPSYTFASHHGEHFYRQLTSGFYRVQLQRGDAAGPMHGLEVLHPFRDRDLVAFLMAVPGEVVNWHGVPKGLLRVALADILPGPIRQRRSKADFTGLVNRAMLDELPSVRRLLTEDCFAVRLGFADGKAIASELSTYEARMSRETSATACWRVSDLVGLEVWLQRFFSPAVA
jgi:asparagine synthase (glutamine-hydrolysing)